MSEKHSAANKRRWATVPKPYRSQIMSLVGSGRWKGTTKAERKEIALKMVKAREQKNEQK